MIKRLVEIWCEMSNEKKFIRMSYGEKLIELADKSNMELDEVKALVRTEEFLDGVYEMAHQMDQAMIADAVSRQHQLLDSRVDMVGLEASKEIINRAMNERKEKAGKDKQSISDKLTDLLNDLK